MEEEEEQGHWPRIHVPKKHEGVVQRCVGCCPLSTTPNQRNTTSNTRRLAPHSPLH